MDIIIRNKKYKEKCPICKNDYKEEYINNGQDIFPLVNAPSIIEIRKFKICSYCFKDIAFDVFSEYEIEGILREKTDNRKKNEPKLYKKNKIPSKLRWNVFKRDNFTCLKCGTRDNLAADHIIPEIKGGKTKLNNLQTLCKKCNSSKGIKIKKYGKI